MGGLWEQLQEKSGNEPKQLLDLNPEEVTYNVERNAVQFLCAAGTLVASLPLSEVQVNSLE